MFKRSYCNI